MKHCYAMSHPFDAETMALNECSPCGDQLDVLAFSGMQPFYDSLHKFLVFEHSHTNTQTCAHVFIMMWTLCLLCCPSLMNDSALVSHLRNVSW